MSDQDESVSPVQVNYQQISSSSKVKKAINYSTSESLRPEAGSEVKLKMNYGIPEEISGTLFEEDEFELYRVDTSDLYAVVKHEERKFIIDFSKNINDSDLLFYRIETKKTSVISKEQKEAFKSIKEMTKHKGIEITSEPRIYSEDDNCIYYDINSCNSSNPYFVTISKASGYEIHQGLNLRFKKEGNQAPQVLPVDGGSINFLDKYINLKGDELFLFKIYLLCSYIPQIYHPLLILLGEASSGKTTISKILTKLVDPSRTEILSLPTEQRTLQTHLQMHYFLAYDNISYISKNVSNDLCQAVTGAGVLNRDKHKDSYTYMKYKRSVVIGGTNLGALRSDLIDRSIIFNLKRISEFEPEAGGTDFESRFDGELPLILGAIFKVLSHAMSIYPQITITPSSRLGDFERWGFACAEAIQPGLGERFHLLYKENMSKKLYTKLDDNPLIYALTVMMEETPEWAGGAQELLEKVNSIAEKLNLAKGKGWPGGANIISNKIDEHLGLLKEHGVDAKRDENRHNKVRAFWRIKRIKESESKPESLSEATPE